MASQKSNNANERSNEGLVNQAKASAGEVVDKARATAGEAASKAQDKALSQAAVGKDRLADSFDNVAQALRSSTQQMQGNELGFVGDYMGRAADKVSELSEHLRTRDVNELIQETESFARREPTVFLAGAFALGLIAARFLKSSGNNQQWSRYDSDTRYETGYRRNNFESGIDNYDDAPLGEDASSMRTSSLVGGAGRDEPSSIGYRGTSQSPYRGQ